MIENFGLIRDRISAYNVVPDRQFRVHSGRSIEEEGVAQKLRQFWADDSIPNAVKLEGFERDISGFDPENTSSREIGDIAVALYRLGIIDHTTLSWLGAVGEDFDTQGNQINMDKNANAFERFNGNLEFLKGYIAEGHDFAKDTLTSLNTAITVLFALQERAQTSRAASLVDTKA